MKQIANVLEIRPGTVAFHKYRMMERLKVKTNAETLKLCDEVPNDVFGNCIVLNLCIGPKIASGRIVSAPEN